MTIPVGDRQMLKSSVCVCDRKYFSTGILHDDGGLYWKECGNFLDYHIKLFLKDWHHTLTRSSRQTSDTVTHDAFVCFLQNMQTSNTRIAALPRSLIAPNLHTVHARTHSVPNSLWRVNALTHSRYNRCEHLAIKVSGFIIRYSSPRQHTVPSTQLHHSRSQICLTQCAGCDWVCHNTASITSDF
jgi:hypothetical protein